MSKCDRLVKKALSLSTEGVDKDDYHDAYDLLCAELIDKRIEIETVMDDLDSSLLLFEGNTKMGFEYNHERLKLFSLDKNYKERFYLILEDDIYKVSENNKSYNDFLKVLKSDQNNISLFSNIRELYLSVKPILTEIAALENKRDIMNGEELKKALTVFYDELNGMDDEISNRKASLSIARNALLDIEKNWNFLSETKYGIIDVDNNITNSIELIESKWVPCFNDKTRKKEAIRIINNNKDILDMYKDNMNDINSFNNKKDHIKIKEKEKIDERRLVVKNAITKMHNK